MHKGYSFNENLEIIHVTILPTRTGEYREIFETGNCQSYWTEHVQNIYQTQKGAE